MQLSLLALSGRRELSSNVRSLPKADIATDSIPRLLAFAGQYRHADWGEAGQTDRSRSCWCQVDYSSPNKRAPIRDAYDDLLAVSQVYDADPSAEWQRPVGRGQGAGVHAPTVGCLTPSVAITVSIHRCNSSLCRS